MSLSKFPSQQLYFSISSISLNQCEIKFQQNLISDPVQPHAI